MLAWLGKNLVLGMILIALSACLVGSAIVSYVVVPASNTRVAAAAATEAYNVGLAAATPRERQVFRTVVVTTTVASGTATPTETPITGNIVTWTPTSQPEGPQVLTSVESGTTSGETETYQVSGGESGDTTSDNDNSAGSPFMFDADSCPPEIKAGCSLDIGVKEGQVGIVFGYHLAWPQAKLDAGGGGCDQVTLVPGWYENFFVLDGRYEVYDLPEEDVQGWANVLVGQRFDEQSADYNCTVDSNRSIQNVPTWTSNIVSPPSGSASSVAPTVQPTAAATARPTAQPTTVKVVYGANRRDMTKAVSGRIPFDKGERVVGHRIELAGGAKCDGGNCFLDKAPENGWVTDGVVDPWEGEFSGMKPWDPTK